MPPQAKPRRREGGQPCGNVQQTTDNENGFWDRSLGNVVNGTATNDPNQIKTASDRVLASGSPRKGDLATASDVAGNFTDLIVKRDGPCLPTGSSCWQRFKYDWDEVGQLIRARRWDLTSTERTNNATTTSPLPSRTPDAELRFAYDAGGSRTLKTAVDSAAVERHTVYVFGGLEIRSTEWNSANFPNDYDQSPEKVQLRLPAGIASARVLYADVSMPTLTSGQQHVFLELADQIGSNTFIIDHATGELVEAATYQAYGATDSDYRPGRWGEFREPYHFSGKEDDIELGLAYFGARYYSPFLGVWMSPDPSTIHEGGSDVNPYAYVNGSPLMGVDPDGREPITLTVIVAAVVIGAVIGAGTSVAIQASTVGWDKVDWGLKGVAGAAIAGAVSGAVTAGAGSVIGGALSSSSSLLGSLGTSTLSGALGAGASYVTSSALAQRSMSWGGFGKAEAAGGAGGLAGGAAGVGGSALAGEMGWSQSASQWAGGVSGAIGGSSGGLATSLAFGDQISVQTVLYSYGGGLAGAMAGMGWDAATTETPRYAVASSGPSPVIAIEERGMTSDELVQALAELHVTQTREAIAASAEALLAEDPGAFANAPRNGPFEPGSNKCNCFVGAAISNAGLNPNGTGWRGSGIPAAGDLARGINLPAGFELVADGGGAMRGDVVAQARNYPDATGHAAVMTSGSDLIQATYGGLKASTLQKSFPANNPQALSPVRFIRYTGKGTNPWVKP